MSSKIDYIFTAALDDPFKRHATPQQPTETTENGMIIERHVAIPLRSKRHAFADTWRPDDKSGKAAPLIAWTPYGKHNPTPIHKIYPNSGVEPSWISDHTGFEQPDPLYRTRQASGSAPAARPSRRGQRKRLEQVEVPALVIASFADQGLHTRGTLEGFKRIGSREKWLICHWRRKWAFDYTPEVVEKQRAFYDKFCHCLYTGGEYQSRLLVPIIPPSQESKIVRQNL